MNGTIDRVPGMRAESALLHRSISGSRMPNITQKEFKQRILEQPWMGRTRAALHLLNSEEFT